MPAAGGLKKSELYIDTPVKRPPVIQGNPLAPFLAPFSPLVKICSYVALWHNPQLSAYTFIWCNMCVLLHVVFGVTTLLTTSLTLLLLTLNLFMVEHSFTKTNITVICAYSAIGVNQQQLSKLPGSDELSQILVNSINSVCNVFLNIRDSSQQGLAQFYFALCTTVAMLTIFLTYLATTTTLLLVFWFLFCYPAIKHHQLHKKVTQEQIVGVFNMSMYMLYSVYRAVVNAVSPEIPPDNDGAGPSQSEMDGTLSEPSATMRSTTMSYLRGLPSSMTLRWGDGLSSWFSRKRQLDAEHRQQMASSPNQATASTESDSDFGIDDIDDDGVAPPVQKTRTQTVDHTLGSNAELEFPSIERKDTLEYEGTQTLAEGLDPSLLYDEDRTFTLDSMGTGTDFTLGGTQRMHLLDAVTESGDEEDREDDSDDDLVMDGRSDLPEFGTAIRSTITSRSDTLDGKHFMLPSPPAEPRTSSSSHRRVKQPSQQSSAATTDTEFYVISDEEIRAAEGEMEESLSSTGSTTSLRERLTGKIKQFSGGPSNPKI